MPEEQGGPDYAGLAFKLGSLIGGELVPFENALDARIAAQGSTEKLADVKAQVVALMNSAFDLVAAMDRASRE